MALVTTGRRSSLKSRVASSKRPGAKFVRNMRAVDSIGVWSLGLGPAANSVVNKREASSFTRRMVPAGPDRYGPAGRDRHAEGRGGGVGVGLMRIMAVVS